MTPTAAGTYRFIDAAAGSKVQLVPVVEINGTLCAQFRDAEADKAWLLVPVEDMAGVWEPA